MCSMRLTLQYDDEIEWDEMSGACNRHARNENYLQKFDRKKWKQKT